MGMVLGLTWDWRAAKVPAWAHELRSNQSLFPLGTYRPSRCDRHKKRKPIPMTVRKPR